TAARKARARLVRQVTPGVRPKGRELVIRSRTLNWSLIAVGAFLIAWIPYDLINRSGGEVEPIHMIVLVPGVRFILGPARNLWRLRRGLPTQSTEVEAFARYLIIVILTI